MRPPAQDVKIDGRGRIELPRRARGRCRWCGRKIKQKRRRNWCSGECVDSYMQASTKSIKAQVRKRDRGICALCGLDTIHLRKNLPRIEPFRSEYLALHQIPKYRVGSRFSDIDHVLPVAEGGKMELPNLRTLCIPCHRVRTRAWTLTQKLGSTSAAKARRAKPA